jgi:hypothetical protein
VRVFESIEGVRIGTVQQVEVDVVGQPPPGFGQPESLTGFNLNVHPALQ